MPWVSAIGTAPKELIFHYSTSLKRWALDISKCRNDYPERLQPRAIWRSSIKPPAAEEPILSKAPPSVLHSKTGQASVLACSNAKSKPLSESCASSSRLGWGFGSITKAGFVLSSIVGDFHEAS